MKPSLRLALIIFLCAFAQAQEHNSHLMTPAEYKEFLDSVERTLPGLESAVKSIDPARTNVSYAAGEQILQFRDLCLKQIGWALDYAEKERTKHTVSGEFALDGFLRGVFDTMETVGQLELPTGASTADMDKYAPALSAIQGRIGNDLAQRIALLEKGTCP